MQRDVHTTLRNGSSYINHVNALSELPPNFRLILYLSLALDYAQLKLEREREGGSGSGRFAHIYTYTRGEQARAFIYIPLCILAY